MFQIDKVDINIHFHISVQQPTDTTEILSKLNAIETLVRQSMDEFRAALAAIDAETTRVADGIAALLERLANGGLTPAEEAEVKAGLDAHLNRLRGIAVDPENPIPPEVPV